MAARPGANGPGLARRALCAALAASPWLGAALLPGCAANSPHPARVEPARFAPWTEGPGAYRIGMGDEIEVKLPFDAEFNDRVTVGPDGHVTLPLVGDVLAQGRTVTDLTDELNRRFARDLRDPRVQVALRSYTSSRIFVGGEVNNPGLYNMPGRIGVIEAISMANGTQVTARLNQVAVIRRDAQGRAMMKVVDITRFVAGTEDDVPLHPFDVVFVPKSTIAEIDQFVDQFINRVVPFNRDFSYTIGTQRNR